MYRRWEKQDGLRKERQKGGRPTRSWIQDVEKAMNSRQLKEEDSRDRRAWWIGCGKR